MRERGAKITDMVIIMVSAIEGVQKQTKEIIDILNKTETPLIVAINKIDKFEADPEAVEKDLENAGILL